MLQVDAVRSGYTAIDVLDRVSLQVPEGKIVAVLGANGAGKTALIRAISGLNAVRGGRIVLDGQRIDGQRTDAIVRRGIIHVPQGRMLFGEMTVLENLEMGGYLLAGRDVLQQRLSQVFEFFPILRERAAQRAAYLSGGEQQMLALGRAMMPKPKVLLLDEPSLGLGPKMLDSILERVRTINATGAAVLIAEQNARKALRIADHCYVLENGRIALDGPAEMLLQDERVEKSYLGATH